LAYADPVAVSCGVNWGSSSITHSLWPDSTDLVQ
jgi:hypothetical protein